MSEILMSRREFVFGAAASFAAVLAGCSAQSTESPAPAAGPAQVQDADPAPTKRPERICVKAEKDLNSITKILAKRGESPGTQVEVYSGLDKYVGPGNAGPGLDFNDYTGVADTVCFVDNP